MADRFLRRFLPFSENHLPGLLYKRKPAYELFFRNMPEHGIVHARFQVSAPLVRRQFISYQNQVNIPAGFPKSPDRGQIPVYRRFFPKNHDLAFRIA